MVAWVETVILGFAICSRDSVFDDVTSWLVNTVHRRSGVSFSDQYHTYVTFGRALFETGSSSRYRPTVWRLSRSIHDIMLLFDVGRVVEYVWRREHNSLK